MSELVFLEQPPSTTATQITTTTWAAEIGGRDTFLITRIKLQDLINLRTGKVNFIGDTKPKLGTLEELTDVFAAAWLYFENGKDKPRVRPLVGGFNGGFQKYAEAEAICRDVWRQRTRYRPEPLIIGGHAL